MRRNQKLWRAFADAIPGVVVCRKPVEELDFITDEMFFIPLDYVHGSENHIRKFAENIQKLRALVSDELEWQQRRVGKAEYQRIRVLLRRFFDTVEMKPGIAGFRVDLRKLVAALRNS